MILAITAAALLISPPPGSTAHNGLQPSQVVSEYQAEVRSLADRGFHQAPGYAWPASYTVDSKGPDNLPMTYERDYGRVDADQYWFLSWADYVCKESSGKTRLNGIRQLERVRDTLYYQKMAQYDRQYYDGLIADAEKGNLTSLRQLTTSNSQTIKQLLGGASSDK